MVLGGLDEGGDARVRKRGCQVLEELLDLLSGATRWEVGACLLVEGLECVSNEIELVGQCR